MSSTKLLLIKDLPIDLVCPHCQQPICRVYRDKMGAIRGGYWLRDGDMLPGIDKELSREQKIPNGFDYMLYVGAQPCCSKDYYVIECNLINARFDNLSDVVYYFEAQDYNQPKTRNFQVIYQGDNKLVPRNWILTQIPSPQGIIYSHLFGPFRLTEKLEGRHGVAACGYLAELNTWTSARQMLVGVWDEMRALML